MGLYVAFIHGQCNSNRICNRQFFFFSSPQERRIYAVAKSGIRLSETSCTGPTTKGETQNEKRQSPISTD